MSRACRAAARAIMFAGVLGVASCSSDGERSEKGLRGWTVLVYMAADNDLDPFAAQNLRELAQAGSAPDTEVIVQVDRHARLAKDSIANLAPFTGTKRLRVASGHLQELADLGETNMADRHVLKRLRPLGNRRASGGALRAHPLGSWRGLARLRR